MPRLDTALERRSPERPQRDFGTPLKAVTGGV